MSEGALSETFPVAAATTDQMETVVREHARFVYAIAYSVLGNYHDAEDAAQETFVRFWRHRKRWRLIRNHRAWLARTVWRVALDAQRKQRRSAAASLSADECVQAVSRLSAKGMPADEIAARAEMAELLNSLIQSLPEVLRNALTLSLAGELASPEIAAILNIPEGTVRQRLWQARQILKQKLSSLLEGNHER